MSGANRSGGRGIPGSGGPTSLQLPAAALWWIARWTDAHGPDHLDGKEKPVRHPARIVASLRAASVALLLLASSLLAVAQAPGSQAAQGCGGAFLKAYVYADGYAQVDVYLENGTTNCIVNRTRGASWGNARWMGVGISELNYHVTCERGATASDRELDCGRFGYYAGPVRIDARNECINFWAAVVKGNGVYRSIKRTGVHCG